MADASFVQDNFTGGEWSPFAKGRITDPDYKRSMGTCLNGIPVEAGAWVRRMGSRELGTTRWGKPGRVATFHFSQTAPFEIELTDQKLRLYNSNGLIFTHDARNVTGISTANPAVITTSADSFETWANGDTIKFFFPSAGASVLGGQLLGREFVITVVSSTQFSLVDALTGSTVDGSQLAYDGTVPIQVARVLEFTTPYVNQDWQNIRFVQDQSSVLFLHHDYPPYVLTAAVECGNVFDFRQAQFIDGPYLDPPLDGSFLTPSAQTGSITLTLGYPAWSSTTTYANGSTFLPNGTRPDIVGVKATYINGVVVNSGGHDYVSIADANLNSAPPSANWLQLTDGQIIGPAGFSATDIGREVRLLSEPNDYVPTSTYALNNLVKYQDQYWIALKAVAAQDFPGNNVNSWGIAVNAATWTWGTITAVGSARACTVSLAGGDLQYNTNVRVWRLGAYSYSTGFPSCGCLHEGRFWLGGAIRNRFDATVSNEHYVMSPTAPDGTVADNNAIAYVFNSEDTNQIAFIKPSHNGLIMGSSAGEWSVAASSNADPLTPTSIQAHRFTKIGCANLEAVVTPVTTVFIQREQRKIMEYFGDLFSGRFVGKNLSKDAKHLTASFVEEIVYQQELNPTLWMRMGDGSLVGSTYKRESLMMAQPPDMNGWHRHVLGSGRLIKSIAIGPSPDGQIDTLNITSMDPKTGIYFVEQMNNIFDEAASINTSWFLDSAKVPAGASVITISGVQTLQLDGYSTVEGQTLEVMIAGLDAGPFVVSNGCLYIPLDGSANGLTLQYIQTFAAGNTALGFNNLPITTPGGVPAQMIQQFAEPADWLGPSYLTRDLATTVDFDGNRVFNAYPTSGPDGGIAVYDATTGKLLQRQFNPHIYGNFRPLFWDATIVYQISQRVLGVDAKLYGSLIDRNVGIDPTTDGGVHWTQTGVLPGAWSAAVTYGAGATVAGKTGTAYYEALVSHPNRDPRADDGTQWKLTGVTPGAAIWSIALTFDLGQVVQVDALFHIYTSIAGSNIGNNPITDGGVHWTDHGPIPAVWNRNIVYGAATIVTGSDYNRYTNLANDNLNHNPVGDGGVHWLNIGPSLPSLSSTILYSGSDDKLYDQDTGGIVRINSETLVAEARGKFPGQQFFDFAATGAETSAGSFATWLAGSDASLTGTPIAPLLFNAQSMQPEPLPANVLVNEGSRSRVIAAPPGVLGEENSCCCATADFFFFGLPQNATTNPITMYKLSINPEPIQGQSRYTWTTQGQIHATDVDATWTSGFFFGGWQWGCYDKTDGNILIGVTAGGAPAQAYYIIKVNAHTGAVMWKVPVNNATNGAEFQMKMSNIFNGQFVYMEAAAVGGNGIARFINTITGTFTSPTFSHFVANKALGIYNSVTGNMILFEIAFSTGAGNDPILGPNTASAFTGLATFAIGRSNLTYNAPGIAGFNYTSQGQVLTPMIPENSGARNGPAMAKTKRSHMYGIAFAQTAQGSTKVGSDFVSMHPANFQSPSGNPLQPGVLFTDTHWDTLENNYGFFSALAWQVTGPYPCVVTAVTQFLHTQDR